jgi:hypothetical protein
VAEFVLGDDGRLRLGSTRPESSLARRAIRLEFFRVARAPIRPVTGGARRMIAEGCAAHWW